MIRVVQDRSLVNSRKENLSEKEIYHRDVLNYYQRNLDKPVKLLNQRFFSETKLILLNHVADVSEMRGMERQKNIQIEEAKERNKVNKNISLYKSKKQCFQIIDDKNIEIEYLKRVNTDLKKQLEKPQKSFYQKVCTIL